MAYLESSRRVGRSQAVSLFWGLVSVFFAAAACYYYWKYHESVTSTGVLRDQVLTLQDQCESLSSEKDKLQAGISGAEAQLKSREEFLQEKESKLADEETRLEALGQLADGAQQESSTQAAVVKKFNDTVRKLAKDDTDVVVRGGRPVLRVPDSALFDFGDATLKPEGKALLGQIADSLKGQLGNFELRVETFTDSEGETHGGDDASGSQAVNLDGKTPKTPGHARSSWELTGARAAALGRFFHDETALPFQNVVVMARADFQPIIATGREAHARNRRTEITLAPVPVAFPPPAADADRSGNETNDDTTTPPAHASSGKPAKAKKGATASSPQP